MLRNSGEITRWLNYICAALLLVVLAIFYGKIHLSRKQQVNATQEPIEKRQKLAALRTSSHLLGWGYLALAITFATQLYLGANCFSSTTTFRSQFL